MASSGSRKPEGSLQESRPEPMSQFPSQSSMFGELHFARVVVYDVKGRD